MGRVFIPQWGPDALGVDERKFASSYTAPVVLISTQLNMLFLTRARQGCLMLRRLTRC